MTTSRAKPGMAFWATVVLVVVPLLYVLSFGPACWLLGSSPSRFAVADAYAPLVMLSQRGTVLHWFATIGTDENALALMRASLENRHSGGHGYPTWLPFAFQMEQIQQY
jgi:hypothetical protein